MENIRDMVMSMVLIAIPKENANQFTILNITKKTQEGYGETKDVGFNQVGKSSR